MLGDACLPSKYPDHVAVLGLVRDNARDSKTLASSEVVERVRCLAASVHVVDS